jgi:hypothetical protein
MLNADFRKYGVTLEENFDGRRMHADFIDDVYPDRTCGQYDRGIWVATSEREFFVSFTDGSVWDGGYRLDARCPEICVMAALNDAREPYWHDLTLDEDSYRVVTS